ncbi:MAG: hypothetical protein QM477_05850 [Planctomycetota bacterium]
MISLAIPLLTAGSVFFSAQEPAPHEIDGLTAVPINIHSVSATVVFDVETKKATVSADMSFEMTGKGGMPVFDLRQKIDAATLDGEKISIEELAMHDFGRTSGTMRILERELKPDVTYVLHLDYHLRQPLSPHSDPIGWGDGRLDWDFFLSDLNPGRYLEMWFPSNLLFDKFKLDLDVQLKGTDTAHTFITNGVQTELAPLHWKVSYPDHFTSFSPLLVIVPSQDVKSGSATFKLNGEKMEIQVTCRNDAGYSVKEVLKQTESHMKEFNKAMGAWMHTGPIVVYLWPGSRSMEYDGATTTAMGALRHELFHSWYGRGVKPVSQNDGWIDEAWDVYFSDDGRIPASRTKHEGKPFELCSSNPWNRTTSSDSYRAGSFFFSRVAGLIGEKNLIKHMASFYAQHALELVSTAQLESYLVEASGNEDIHQLFHRYVYGKEGKYNDKQ